MVGGLTSALGSMKVRRSVTVMTLLFGVVPAASWTVFLALLSHWNLQGIAKVNLHSNAFVFTLGMAVVAGAGSLGLCGAAFVRQSSVVTYLLVIGLCATVPAALALAFFWPLASASLFFPAATAFIHLFYVTGAREAQQGIQADGPASGGSAA